MNRQEILKEKEIISYMILGNIQKKHKPNQLYDLLVRQAWLSSGIKEESDNIKWQEFKSGRHLEIFH
jgi:hypothetical protein